MAERAGGLPPPILRPSAVAVLPAVRPAPDGASTTEGSSAVAWSAVASTAASWAPFAADGEEAPDADASTDMQFAPAVVAGGAAVVAGGATAEAPSDGLPRARRPGWAGSVRIGPTPLVRRGSGAGERPPRCRLRHRGLAGLVAVTPTTPWTTRRPRLSAAAWLEFVGCLRMLSVK
jgi:hypothetical protein